MSAYLHNAIWLNETEICTLEHLAEISGLSQSELSELINSGSIEPANQDPEHYVFHLHAIVIARKARRLRDDFELDTHGMAVAITLLRRISKLEQELAKIKNRVHE